MARQSAGPSIVRRYRDVAGVLVRHGLADVVDTLQLGKYLAWGARALPVRAPLDPSLSRSARFRLTLEELGPRSSSSARPSVSVRICFLPTSSPN